MDGEPVSETLDPGLVAAVSAVVDERGWSRATTGRIAEAAGVNRTTLYRKGYSAERLLAEAASAVAVQFRRATLEPLAAPGSAHDRLLALLDVLYDLADEHLGLVAGLYDGAALFFHLSSAGVDTNGITRFEYTEPFARLLADGLVDGTLTCDEPGADAEVLFNTAGWTYVHLRRSHGWPVKRARAQVTRIATAAFLPS